MFKSKKWELIERIVNKIVDENDEDVIESLNATIKTLKWDK